MINNIFYHHIMCPLSRQIRLYLKELNIECQIRNEEYWLKRKDFMQINKACTLPVLILNNHKLVLKGTYTIIEYFTDQYKNFYFMPDDIANKANVRNYLSWFNDKFYREVSKIIIDEKMVRLLMRLGAPNTAHLKVAKHNFTQHMRFLSDQLEQNSYIVSEKISCADIAAAAHISVLDYFGEINWDSWFKIKYWYAIIKSRPSFKQLLEDRIPGFVPSKEYSDPDF